MPTSYAVKRWTSRPVIRSEPVPSRLAVSRATSWLSVGWVARRRPGDTAYESCMRETFSLALAAAGTCRSNIEHAV
jgi:hypothetical protein